MTRFWETHVRSANPRRETNLPVEREIFSHQGPERSESSVRRVKFTFLHWAPGTDGCFWLKISTGLCFILARYDYSGAHLFWEIVQQWGYKSSMAEMITAEPARKCEKKRSCPRNSRPFNTHYLFEPCSIINPISWIWLARRHWCIHSVSRRLVLSETKGKEGASSVDKSLGQTSFSVTWQRGRKKNSLVKRTECNTPPPNAPKSRQ